MNAEYLEVNAKVRYWEDASVDGIKDVSGTLIPFRFGDLWCPVIRLSDGLVMGWPEGKLAEVYYKVCDEGKYYLLDDQKHRIAERTDYYVPDKFLCHGDDGYGDYIILKINGDGVISDYKLPKIIAEDWKTFTTTKE